VPSNVGVRESAKLRGDGRVDFRHAVPEQVAPQCGGAIEQPAPEVVDQIVALGRHDHQRLARQVLLHLCERMPHVLRIPLPEKAPGAFFN
jgi:hypothetical protein